MKYVRFLGSTPFIGTDYEEYAVFEDEATEDEIKQHGKESAIENALFFAWKFDETLNEPTMEEYNIAHQNYLSTCIDALRYEFLDEKDFYAAMEDNA